MSAWGIASGGLRNSLILLVVNEGKIMLDPILTTFKDKSKERINNKKYKHLIENCDHSRHGNIKKAK